MGVQEWGWPGSAGGGRRAEFAGDLCTSTLVNKIKNSPAPASTGICAWQSQRFATIV